MPGEAANKARHAETDNAGTSPAPLSVPVPPALPVSAPQEPEETCIGPLLARANLLRMRGQWNEAVAACTEALRRVPRSPTACSLLGGIYEAQNRLEDALQWYSMAVEFDASNKADRDKLDILVQTQRRALLQQEKEAQTRAPRVDPANRTLRWFDRVFPPGRQGTIARLMLFVGGLLSLLLVFTTAFVYWGNQTDTPPSSVALGGLPVSPDTVSPALVVQPRTGRAAPPVGASTPTPAPTPSASAQPFAATVPGIEPQRLPAPAPNDAALMETLARVLPPGAVASAAQVDSRLLQVTIALRLDVAGAKEAGPLSAATRERVLRVAALSARAAALTLPALERASVRVSLRPPGESLGSTGDGASLLAFVAETATTAVRAANPATASVPELRGLFTNVWWIPSSNDEEQPPTPGP